MLVRPLSSIGPRALRKTRTAFTLLEVLVVVAIIVMLAGVGGFYLLQRYEEAKLSRAKIDCEALSSAAENYKLRNGNYPASIEQLAQQQPDGGQPFIAPDKVKDPWGKSYQIDPNGPHNGGNRADVFTTGPKGQIIGNFAR
jgi:general secretion pathway protein G